MDTLLYQFEVIKGKESVAEEWLNFLNENKEKGKNTLKNEKVYFESYFKEKTESGLKIYMVIVCEDIQKANETALNSGNEIDKKHFAYMKECLDLEKGAIMESALVLNNLEDYN